MSLDENCFESGLRKVIPAVLVYLQREDEVLMLHRNTGQRPVQQSGQKRPDFHEGKWNGLGGKCEKDESPWEAARREVREESGLDLSPAQFNLLGVLQFPNFKPHKNEDWIVFVFTGKVTSLESQQIKSACDEGSLHWVPNKDLLSLNLWPGDVEFLPYVLESKPFAGTLWYSEQKVVRTWIQPFST